MRSVRIPRIMRAFGVGLALVTPAALMALAVATVLPEPAGASAPLPSGPEIGALIADGDLIRVGISDDAMRDYEYPQARLGATGPSILWDLGARRVLAKLPAGAILMMSVSKNGFLARRSGLAAPIGPTPGPLSLRPENPQSRLLLLSSPRRGQTPRYRGEFEILRGASSPNRLTVVNVLPIQDYLKAVVPNELPPRFGLEAVRAQAVAARNYAIRPREKPWPHFDICDSQYCQVYFGSQTEHPDTSRALEETRGLIALYRGEPILALYSSSHGGVSENYENAFSEPRTDRFPAAPLPYLSSVADSPAIVQRFGNLSQDANAQAFWRARNLPSYDAASSYQRWQRVWPGDALERTLRQTLPELAKDALTCAFVSPPTSRQVGAIRDVRVTRRGVSGKAMAILIETDAGDWQVQKEFVIRKALALNGRMLPSANVVLTPQRDALGRLASLTIDGGGFGHGVGMSQYGAGAMSAQGRNFVDILQHYYRGAAIGTIPLRVGRGSALTPSRLTFYARKSSGVLFYEAEGEGAAPRVTLNGRMIALSSIVSGADGGKRLGATDLRAPGVNTLILTPDARNPQRRLRAWIELYPARL